MPQIFASDHIHVIGDSWSGTTVVTWWASTFRPAVRAKFPASSAWTRSVSTGSRSALPRVARTTSRIATGRTVAQPWPAFSYNFVDGRKTGDIVGGIPACMVPGVTVVLVELGLNDVNGAVPQATITANARSIRDDILATTGVRWVQWVGPFGIGETWNPIGDGAIDTCDTALRSMMAEVSNSYYCSLRATWLTNEPIANPGNLANGVYLQADNLHLTAPLGQNLIGTTVAATLTP